MSSSPLPTPALQAAVVASVLLSLAAVRWLDRERDWGRRRRSRLLLGIPWGTLVSVALVLAVYLFVQGGWDHWRQPVTIPFRSWSYFYPLGMVTSAFAHDGPGHLIGNLVGTLVLAPMAEYAWGHFPRERGAGTFTSLRTNPYARAFLGFPAGVLAVGLLTSLFSWGPLIGFSGVVFAFAGFALVRYPLGTVIALAARGVLRVIYRALREPVLVAQAEPRFVEPWWAGISVQGHLLGLFLGIVLAAVVLRRRDLPGPARLWAGALLVATSLSLWAVWWFRGGSSFVLYRGLGVPFVFAIALLVAVAVRARTVDRPVLGVPRRQVAVIALLFPILVVSLVAVPLNLNTVAAAEVPNPDAAIEVRDYTVTYAENVTNGMTSVVNVSAFGETTQVRTSGVIVISRERGLWTTAASRSRLGFAGRLRVHLGGPGWRERVDARRRGWSAVGGGTTYKVWLRPPGGAWNLAFVSGEATADPRIAGRNVTLRAAESAFVIDVRRNGSTVGRAPVPAEGENVTAGGLRFTREGNALYAATDGTRVRVGSKETYRGESALE